MKINIAFLYLGPNTEIGKLYEFTKLVKAKYIFGRVVLVAHIK